MLHHARCICIYIPRVHMYIVGRLLYAHEHGKRVLGVRGARAFALSLVTSCAKCLNGVTVVATV